MPEAAIVIAPAPAARLARFQARSHPRRLARYLQAREQRHAALPNTPSAHTNHHHTTLSFISPVLFSTILLSLVRRTRRLSTQRAGTQAREFHCSARHPALKLHRPHTHARRQLSTCFTLTAQPSNTLRRRAAQSKAPLSTHHHHPSRLPHCTSYTTLFHHHHHQHDLLLPHCLPLHYDPLEITALSPASRDR